MEGPTAKPRWCLFLDIDGTLLELAATPDVVQVDSATLDLLARLAGALHGAVALVSGRPIIDIDRLFGPRRWPAAGVHGLERRDALGRWHIRDTIDAAAIARARERLQQLSDRLPGTLLEDKGLSLALHFRQAPQFEAQVRREAQVIAREVAGECLLLEGRMVLELRPAGPTKAVAVREFLGEPPFRGGRPIFIGDDYSDQDALAEVERMGGLSVAVGDRVRGMRGVAGPREVRGFLETLATTGAPPS